MSAVIHVNFGALLDAPHTPGKSRAFDRRRVFVPLIVVWMLVALRAWRAATASAASAEPPGGLTRPA